MKYPIDKNTPVPPPGGGKPKPSLTETLEDMPANKTQSFLVPVGKKKPETVRGSIMSTITTMRKRYPERKYTTRYLPEQKGIRVWRLK